MARVHYEIPDDLHRRAKAAAAMRGMTLKDFVIEALDALSATSEADLKAQVRQAKRRGG